MYKHILFVFSIILLVTTTPDAAVTQDLLVSFSRIEMQGKDDKPEVELFWNVFRKVENENAYEEYPQAASLSYTLEFDGKEMPAHGTHCKITNRLALNQEYLCRIRINETTGIRDITNEVNGAEGKTYNEAKFTLRQGKSDFTWPSWMLELREYVVNFFQNGAVFLISYILAVVFAIGLLAAIFYSIKLFLLPRNWPYYIRRAVNDFDSILREPSGKVAAKGPVLEVIKTAKHKAKQYRRAAAGEIDENNCHKLARIEKSMKNQTQARFDELAGTELKRVAGIEVNKITGRRGKHVVDFLFSIEHFWNFGVIAPFLGLLGTVTGISKAFGTVSMFSTLSTYKEILTGLSSGINEALYTTIGGLIVGISFLGFYYLFTWRIDTIQRALDSACDQILRKIETQENTDANKVLRPA